MDRVRVEVRVRARVEVRLGLDSLRHLLLRRDGLSRT